MKAGCSIGDSVGESDGSDASTATEQNIKMGISESSVFKDARNFSVKDNFKTFEILQQQLAVQALKRGDFRAVALITTQFTKINSGQSQNVSQNDMNKLNSNIILRDLPTKEDTDQEIRAIISPRKVEDISKFRRKPDPMFDTPSRASEAAESSEAEAESLSTCDQSESREMSVIHDIQLNHISGSKTNTDLPNSNNRTASKIELLKANSSEQVAGSPACARSHRRLDRDRMDAVKIPTDINSHSLPESPSISSPAFRFKAASSPLSSKDRNRNLESEVTKDIDSISSTRPTPSPDVRAAERQALGSEDHFPGPESTSVLIEEGSNTPDAPTSKFLLREVSEIPMIISSINRTVGNAEIALESGWAVASGSTAAIGVAMSSPNFPPPQENLDDLLVDEADLAAARGSESAVAVVPRVDSAAAEPYALARRTQSAHEADGAGVSFTKLLTTVLEAGAAAQQEERALAHPARATAQRDRVALAARRKQVYSERALLCLPLDSPLRKMCCTLLEWPWFDRLILTAIASNCVFMAIDDPPNQREATAYNRMLFVAGAFFQGVFTLEAIIKITARGLLLGQGAYLRDWWNVMDLAVVFLGLVAYAVELGASATVLRTFRLVRPLRSLSAVGRFKDLRMMVNLIVSCLPLLVDVFTLVAFIFLVFGIVSIQVGPEKKNSSAP